MDRKVSIKRETAETEIELTLNIDGSGEYQIETSVPFMNHMLDLLAKHGLFDLNIAARGDIEVDYHHLIEDLGIVLGEAFNRALGERRGINRYGFWVLPMDDALAQAEVALDLGGRPYLVYKIASEKECIRDFELGLMRHFWRSFSDNAKMNLHIDQKYGADPHHAHEAIFKSVARALRMACATDPRLRDAIPSSKGTI